MTDALRSRHRLPRAARAVAVLVLVLAAMPCCIPMPPPESGGAAPSSGAGGSTYSGEPTSEPTGAAPAPVATAAEGPPPMSSVGVTIRSRCRETVKVFYGDEPKFGSGTQSTVSSNSVSSHTFRPGDRFWLVDDSGNGVSSIEVSGSTREIEITESCSGLVSR